MFSIKLFIVINNEQIANRIREALLDINDVEEKKMFSGITFMVNGKMCLVARKLDMMVRIDPTKQEEALSKRGCELAVMKGRGAMNGFVLVSEEGMNTNKDFQYWVGLALEFNKRAKASKKRTNKKND